MNKILFITNYKKDNQYSMSKYNLIHLKSLQKNSNFTVYECSIRDLIFERVNNSILRSLNKYFLFPIYIFFKSFGYDLIHISDQGNAYLNIFIPKKTIITCHDMILIKKKKSIIERNDLFKFKFVRFIFFKKNSCSF